MTKKIEHLYVHHVFMPTEIKNRSTAVKEAEKYCATSPEKRLNDNHGYFKQSPIWLVYPAIFCSIFGIFGSPAILLGSPIFPVVLMTAGACFWLSSIRLWRKHKTAKLVQYQAEWQKQQNIATDKLSIATKNLTIITEFFIQQVAHFNKYQRYIESGAITLDETHQAERKKLCDKLDAIGNNLNKRVNQLDYLLNIETKPALDQEVAQMIDLLGQTEIGNEIARLMDPRFRTLSEIELENKALALLEELPQQI